METTSRIRAGWRRLYRRGAKAWPAIFIPLGDYEAIVRDRGIHPSEVRRPNDLYLATACSLGNRHALAALETLAIPQARQAVAKILRSNALVDEALQRLRTRLLVGGDGKRPRIAEFEGRGELSSWVSVSAMRIAQNLIRDEGRSAARDVDVRSAWEQAIDALGTGDIELDHLKLQYSDAFSTAIRSAFYELPGREQMLLQLYFAGSFKIHEIAATYQVPRSTAGRWVLQARRQLFLRTCARVRGSLGMSASEVTSLWRKILSRLSLDHMLEQRTDPRRWPPQQNSMPE